MSYNGTVRCSHCLRTGHNRRSCPDITSDLKVDYKRYLRRAKDYLHVGDNSSAATMQTAANVARDNYIKRTGFDPATDKPVQRKVAKSKRLKNTYCGYCGERGHTRRTCKHLKNDKKVYIQLTKQWRKKELAHAISHGIGIGSLVPFKEYGYHRGEYGYYTELRFVRAYRWKYCAYGRNKLSLLHCKVSDVPQFDLHALVGPVCTPERMMEGYEDARKEAEYHGLSIPDISLVSRIKPPKGWLDCEDKESKEVIFKDTFPSTGVAKRRQPMFAFPDHDVVDAIKKLGLEKAYNVRV